MKETSKAILESKLQRAKRQNIRGHEYIRESFQDFHSKETALFYFLSDVYMLEGKEERMIKLRIEGNKIDDLVGFLSNSNSSSEDICKANIMKEIDNKRVGFFVYEGFYFRTQRTVSGSVFLYQTNLTSCEIVIVGSGGASAIGTTWGAQEDIEKKISGAILDCAKKLGMKGNCFS